MAGLIVQLLVSWLLVWLYNRRGLGVLGFKPTMYRLQCFIIFLLLAFACSAFGETLKAWFSAWHWRVNADADGRLMLSGLWWNIKSVLFEELIFRGVLLYILIRVAGWKRAGLISAAAFGVYHWFSYGIIGSVVPMVYVFIITGIMGWVLAYAYYRSGTLYIPAAIHLGWNFAQNTVFSNGSVGAGLLLSTQPAILQTDSYLVYIIVSFLPMILVWSGSIFLVQHFYGHKRFINHSSLSISGN